MIQPLLDALHTAGREATHDQVADLIWLLSFMPREAAGSRAEGQKQLTGTPDADQAFTETGPKTESGAKSEPVSTGGGGGSSGAPKRPSAPRAPGSLFAPSAASVPVDRSVPVVPLRIPAADALPHRTEMARVLRPLKRRWRSQSSLVLDEEATVEQIANGGPITPVLTPEMERWLEIALVIDESASMRVWYQTTRDLAEMLLRQGAFRDVRKWFLNLDQDVKLYSEPGLGAAPRRIRDLKELIDASGRRAILVATDCMATAWRDGSMFRVLERWGRRGPVALIQMLPQRMWMRTGLGGRTEQLRAPAAAAANRLLKVKRPAPHATKLEDLKLPVMTLTPQAVGRWARMVAAVGDATAAGAAFAPADFALPPVRKKSREEPDTEKRIALARAQMSPEAFELAAYLAAAPLVMPVMRLVQAAMMREPAQTHLAEVLLGGLVRQQTPAGAAARPDEIVYEFKPGVREALQARLHNGDKLVVLRAVSNHVARRIGAVVDWQALIEDPTGQSKLLADPVGQEFARIAPELLRGMGWTSPALPTPYEGPVAVAAIARGGTLAATACGPGVNLWDLANMRPIATFEDGDADVCSLVFDDRTQLVAAGYADGQIRIWGSHRPQGEWGVIGALAGHTGPVWDVEVVGPAWLVSASADGTLRVWDTESGKCLRVMRPETREPLRRVAVLGRTIMAAGESAVYATADTFGSQLIAIPNTEPATDLARADGPLGALSVSQDGSVLLWRGESPEPATVSREGAGVLSCALSHDGGLAFLGRYDGSIEAVDVRSGAEVWRAQMGHDPIAALAFSDETRLLIAASLRGAVEVWTPSKDHPDGRLVEAPAGWLKPVSTATYPQASGITGISASPEGTAIAFRVNPDACLIRFRGGEALHLPGRFAAWNPNGSVFASEIGTAAAGHPVAVGPTSWGAVGVIWIDNHRSVIVNRTGGHVYRGWDGPFRTPEDLVAAVGSSDCPFYAFGDVHGTIFIAWRTEDLSEPKVFLAERVDRPSVYPEATFAWSRTPISLSRGATGQPLCPNPKCGAGLDPDKRRCDECGEFWETCGNCGKVFSDYAPRCPGCGQSGSGLAPYRAVLYFSRPQDREIRLWREDTPESKRFTTLHDDEVRSLSASHDGLLLCASMASGAVRIWSTETGIELAPAAESRQGRSLVAAFHARLPWLYTATGPVLQLWSYDSEAILAPARPRRVGKKILVVGTALYELPLPVIQAARAVGSALAAAGFDLITGGCRGVDYLVAGTYVETMRNRGTNVEESFTQVIEEWRDPDFPGGGTVKRVSSDAEWHRWVGDTADALIVIGGQDGAHRVAQEFHARGKPVVPLAGTGGTAQSLGREIGFDPELGELWGVLGAPVKTLPQANFAALIARAALEAVFEEDSERKSTLRAALHALFEFMQLAAPKLFEVAWRSNPDLALAVLKCWLSIPPGRADAEPVLALLPRLFGSEAAVAQWFEEQFSASPAEWLARLDLLELLPIARRYLEPKPWEKYHDDEEELRRRMGARASDDAIRACVRSDDMASRVLGYVGLQTRTASPENLDLAPCFALERRDSRRWRETRPLWQLLACIDRIAPDRRSPALLDALDDMRVYLYANDDLDPGRECRSYLENILFRHTVTDRTVGLEDVRLESSCWRAPQFDAEHQAVVYRFDVAVSASDEALNRIHRVEYDLPPAWNDRGRNRAHQVIVSRRSRFKLKELTYASDLDVHAEIHVWGQSDPIRVSTVVKLAEAGPHLE